MHGGPWSRPPSASAIDERDVVRYDRCHVDDVLKVSPEAQLGRRRHEPDGQLDGEPGRTDGLDDEERIEEVRRLVLDAVRHREDRERLNTEKNDGDESHDDGHNGDDVGGARRLRVLEQQPQSTEYAVGRKWSFVGGVTFGAPVVVHSIRFQLVELEFGEEDVVGDVGGAAQSAAVLVVGEHGLEAWPVSVEEQLVAAAVVIALAAGGVAEQGRRMSAEQAGADLELLAAHVDADASPAVLAGARAGQQRVVAARTDRVQTVEARTRRRVAAAGGGQRMTVERQRRRHTAHRLVVPAQRPVHNSDARRPSPTYRGAAVRLTTSSGWARPVIETCARVNHRDNTETRFRTSKL